MWMIFLVFIVTQLAFHHKLCSSQNHPEVRIRVRGTIGLESSELEQFEHYESLTRHYNTKFATQSKCSLNITDHGLLGDCVEQERVKSVKNGQFPAFWPRKVTIVEGLPHYFAVDCQYSLLLQPHEVSHLYDAKHGLFLQFFIQQSECISKTSIKGGASFEITANNSKFLVNCGVTDYFDDIYGVRCYLPAAFATDGESGSKWIALKKCISITGRFIQ
jgi:hypothetical protein